MMNKKPQTKKIKIVSKGIVMTSRGRCRTPILTPYVENVDSILSMLTRDKAKIVEILPDKREVELTIYNFSQDNVIRDPITKEAAPAHVADPKVVHAGIPAAQKPTQDRPLTRKERRELERKARAEAAAKEAKVEEPEVTPEQPIVEETVVTEEPVMVPTQIPTTVEEASGVSTDAIDD